MIRGGESVKLTGRVTQNKSGIYLANPEFEKLGNLPIDSHDTLLDPSLRHSPFAGEKYMGFYPIYAETRGITSKWFYHAIEKF